MMNKSPTPDEIRALRKSLNLNRGDFGALAQVSAHTIQAYEQGWRLCPPLRWHYFKQWAPKA